MRVLSEFLGMMKSFALFEIQGLLATYGGRIERVDEHYAIIQTDSVKDIARRITLSRRLGRIVEEDEIDMGNRTFAVRPAKHCGSQINLRGIVGRINGRVDLDHPDTTFYAYDEGEIITENIFERRESSLLDYRFKNRPFNHPSSISPMIARAMINVGSLKQGDLFVDPFAGTGTFLTEGYRMDIKGIGIDRDRKMVEGCRKNLIFFGFPDTVMLGDFSLIRDFEGLSAIVTDPPYGRGARVFSDSRESLYSRMFSTFSDIRVPKVFVLPSAELLNLAKQYMELEIVETVRVHSSLTRIIVKA
ncbi:MAG: hypothetical protein QW100_03270 [Thermoplasmatales archaeon]